MCTNKKQESNNDVFIAKDSSWKSMTVREKIGQLMIIDSRIYDQQKSEGGLEGFFKQYPVSGFFMANWYFEITNPADSTASKIKQAVRDYAAATKYPLFFMEDYERGVGERFKPYTHLPVEMALGAANDPKLGYQYEKAIALEAKEIGINWLLHPVADLNMHPMHSLLNERAVSDNVDIALPILSQQVKGLQDQNVIATIKHFPGDGTTLRDQHILTASNTMDMPTWKQTFGKLFQQLIDEGAASVMVGHLTFPAYQKEKFKDGRYLPATLSKEIITTLLKEEMNFKGVVISDALNMGGLAGYYDTQMEATVESFKAGIDVLLWPELAVMDTLEAMINRGEIPMSRLDDAVSRVWALKERFGLLQKDKQLYRELTPQDKTEIHAFGTTLAERALTLISDAKTFKAIDTTSAKNILLVNASTADKSAKFETTKQLLTAKGYKVDLQYGLSFFGWNWRVPDILKYDKIILCLDNTYLSPVGVPFLKGLEAETVWMVRTLPKDRVIVVSYSNPYYLSYYFESFPMLINAYSSDNFSQAAIVKALTGEIPINGKSPVKLEHDILK